MDPDLIPVVTAARRHDIPADTVRAAIQSRKLNAYHSERTGRWFVDATDMAVWAARWRTENRGRQPLIERRPTPATQPRQPLTTNQPPPTPREQAEGIAAALDNPTQRNTGTGKLAAALALTYLGKTHAQQIIEEVTRASD